MLDQPKREHPNPPWRNLQHVAKARLVHEDKSAARQLRAAIEKKAGTAKRLLAAGGVPEEV
jgi:hypothetical protein